MYKYLNDDNMEQGHYLIKHDTHQLTDVFFSLFLRLQVLTPQSRTLSNLEAPNPH